MSRVPLENSAWGFTSSCFVCEPTNHTGLRIPFFHDDEAATVVADFNLGEEFSGAPTYVHGGIVNAILDEAMAWGTIAIAKSFAVTATSTTNFLRPVRVGRQYSVTAKVTDSGDDELTTAAVIADEKGRACAEATARFVPLSPAMAKDAIGTDVTGSDADYLRG